MISHPSHIAAIHAGAKGTLTGLNRPIVNRQLTVSQKTNTPDINLERDVVPVMNSAAIPQSQVLLGIETAELEEEREKQRRSTTSTPQESIRGATIAVEQDEFADSRFKINVSTILISALLFLLVLAWFDFIQSAFYSWLSPEFIFEDIPPAVKLWYAILATVFILILVYLVYYYSRDFIK